ncbi:MAG: thermonuclease family protein [Nitrospirota bacterium]
MGDFGAGKDGSVARVILCNMSKSKHFYLLLFFLLFSLFCCESYPEGDIAINVKDGDTVVIQPANGKKYTCRLYGIDAPETAKRGKPGQPFGDEAKDALSSLVRKKQVEVEIKDRDRYGRAVCILKLDGADINRKMIELGLAWAYIEYLKGPYVSIYYDAEKEARAKRLGLWQQSNPLPPWEFRKLYRRR